MGMLISRSMASDISISIVMATVKHAHWLHVCSAAVVPWARLHHGLQYTLFVLLVLHLRLLTRVPDVVRPQREVLQVHELVHCNGRSEALRLRRVQLVVAQV